MLLLLIIASTNEHTKKAQKPFILDSAHLFLSPTHEYYFAFLYFLFFRQMRKNCFVLFFCRLLCAYHKCLLCGWSIVFFILLFFFFCYLYWYRYTCVYFCVCVFRFSYLYMWISRILIQKLSLWRKWIFMIFFMF